MDFGMVRLPGTKKAQRIRINMVVNYGRFKNDEAVEDCLNQVRAECLGRFTLGEVLLRYVQSDAATVLWLWNEKYLAEQARKHRKGKLSKKRREELERYEGRGHLAFWAGFPIYQVTAGKLHQWVAWLDDEFPHLSPRTQKHLVADFGTFLRYVSEHLELLDRVPTLPPIDVPQYQPKVPEKTDLGRILAAIPVELRGVWYARSLAGLRPSEARRLDVGDYDFAKGELTIPPGKSKTKKGRNLPIAGVVPVLHEWLVAHRMDAHKAAPLFTNPKALNEEKRWKPTTERLTWIRALDFCGFEHIKPNEGGRHAFATHEIADGTDAYAVKDWLGHTNLKTTEGYTHVSAVTLVRRMRPLPKIGQSVQGGSKR